MTGNDEKIDNDVMLIKSEFLLSDHVPTLVLDYVSENDKKKILDEDEPLDKKTKCANSKNRNILKGQNKSRGPTFKQEKVLTLCPKLIDIPLLGELPLCNIDKCKFLHDTSLYLSTKRPDINEECYLFTTKGYCSRGITCRFGKSHLTEDGRNIKKADFVHNVSNSNFLTKELQFSLRKRTYNFEKSNSCLKALDKRKIESTNISETCSTVNRLGYVEDHDIIRLRPQEKKTINWKNKLILSPLTTVGNLPFRRICKEFGADITCGEMALASSLLQGMQQEWALVRRHQSEDIFGVQLCGNNPYVMTKCAQLLQEKTDIDFIDVNLGCPIDKIYEQGAGSGLLRRKRILENVLYGMNNILNIPLTVKTRTGIYKDAYIAHDLIPHFVKCGVSLISIHGRTREQRYTKLADWNYIDECAKLTKDIPVFGNGDVLSYIDYNEKLELYPHVSGVLIARGALYKPWLFTEIKEQRHWDISSSERMDIIKKYVNYGLEHWGSDDKGVENTRRFLLEWLSFLHRYIPVGLLERPPQKINQRPPVYKGRNDLETLFASPNCKDWIKISEMLLGPIPEEFHFLPKHKASSWK
ncbi:hypothetical protein PGB90_003219 [Kerria lacca]